MYVTIYHRGLLQLAPYRGKL